jgi:hypothetical protein
MNNQSINIDGQPGHRLQNQDNASPAVSTIKMGLDVHQASVVVAVQWDHSTPKSPQRLSADALVGWIKRLKAQGHRISAFMRPAGLALLFIGGWRPWASSLTGEIYPLSAEFSRDPARQPLWTGFLKRIGVKDVEPSFEIVALQIAAFVQAPVQAISQNANLSELVSRWPFEVRFLHLTVRPSLTPRTD